MKDIGRYNAVDMNMHDNIVRREFLKRLGLASAATAAAMAGCDSKRNPLTADRSGQGEVPSD